MDQLREPEERIVERPEPTRPGSRSGWLWFVFVVLLAIAGGLWWQRLPLAEKPPAPTRTEQPVSVGASTVQTGNINVTVSALGTVTSMNTVVVRPQVSGQLIQVDFQEGQDVKKGDLLAQIDPRPFEAALQQAQGQLARDEALLKGAQVDLKRYQGLAAQNAVARQTLDTQTALVGQYQGTVEADKALVEAATVNLGYCRILSPLDGRTGLRQIDAGNYVTPGDPAGIVVITQIQPISVLFTVPEDQLPAISQRVQQGAQLPVAAYDRTGTTKLAEGVLQTFDSQIDPSTGTIKLRAFFENTNRILYPNQFVNAVLLLNEHKNVAVMPTAAIQHGVPGTFAYVINSNDTVSVRKIALGAIDRERAEVVSGLAAGDRVVVDGADKLREGAPVRVHEQEQAASPAQAQQDLPRPDVTPPPPERPQGGQRHGGNRHTK